MNGDVRLHPRRPPRSASGLHGAAVRTDALPLIPLCHCWERGAKCRALHASERPDSSWAGLGHMVVSGGQTDRKPVPEWPEGAADREPDSVDLGRGNPISPVLWVSVWVASVLEGSLRKTLHSFPM